MRRFFAVLSLTAVSRALLVGSFALFALLAVGSLVAPAWGAQKGVIDYRIERANVDPVACAPIIADIGSAGLHARWTRVMVHWNALQPSRPTATSAGYDESYLSRLDTVIAAFRDAGVKVILTPVDVPAWASDHRLWKSPPKGYKKGVYQPFYALDTRDPGVVGAFGDLGRTLATRYRPLGVEHFEVWNEPNTGLFLYPQRLGSSSTWGVRVYAIMLKAYSKGVRSVMPKAVVIAGATSPRGGNDKYSTSPQAFAKALLRRGVSSYFSAYSHHPYTPGGSKYGAPDRPPNTSWNTVTLYNLSTLTKLMPKKDFYLTEYGYSTKYSYLFGYVVSEATQARYMKKAYAMLRSNKRVRALIWYLYQDWGVSGQPYNGVYTGLVSLKDRRKPSWNTFRALP